jgi:hypothetical protein
VPLRLTWQRSGKLAHFIDGYAVAGGQERLIEIMHAKRAEYEATGAFTGDAKELWLALFGEWRSDRWGGGYPKSKAETKLLNTLARAIEKRLRTATPQLAQELKAMYSEKFFSNL